MLRVRHEIAGSIGGGDLERRRCSAKASRPYGEAHLWLGASLLLCHIARYAPSSCLAPITNLGLPIVPVIS